MGSNENNFSIVHDNFKCIVFENSLSEHDPPFLSRFEKQVLSFDKIKNERLKLFWNDTLLNIYLKANTSNNKYQPHKLVVNLSEEIIESMWLKRSSSGSYDSFPETEESYFEEIIIRNSTADVLLLIYDRFLADKSKKILYLKFSEIYKKQNHHCLQDFLEPKEKVCSKPFILVYTLSKLGDKLKWHQHKQCNIDDYKSYKNLEDDLSNNNSPPPN